MVERRRYRKVNVRMWGDDKFNQLSRPKPNAQTLFMYLITGPHTGVLPGLFLSGEAALAEALNWTLGSFRTCFRELASRGMVTADWSRRVVWLPNAVKHNPPENPNVVKAWRSAMDEIPECALKEEASSQLGEFLSGMGEAFQKAFTYGFTKHSGKSSAKQEQEQEQEPEQEQEQEPAAMSTETALVVAADEKSKSHRGHHFCGRVCLPKDLYAEFLRKVGRDRELELNDWIWRTNETWQARSEAIGDDDWTFWRKRFKESVPATQIHEPSKVRSAAARVLSARDHS